jgi:hypothetical protein
LIEDTTRLSEELKLREDRLGELLAPSEAALRARSEYLDKVMRAELSRAGEQVLKLGEEVERIARSLSDQLVQMPARLAEADAMRWRERQRRERWRTIIGVLAMLLGGFLAGEMASWRSGGAVNPRPPSAERGASPSKGAAGAAPSGGPGHQAQYPARALSRAEIARSADLQ